MILNFLKNHYEKIAIVFFALTIVIILLALSGSIGKVKKEVQELMGDTLFPPSAKNIEEFSADKFKGQKIVTAKTENFWEKPSKDEKILFSFPKHILCVNSLCKSIIPFSAEKCPFCGAEQYREKIVVNPNEEKEKGPKPEDDNDKDGIANMDEDKFSFLNPNNQYDVFLDQDNDGFTNKEEFLAKTKMDDPTSHPPLVSLLRLYNIKSEKLNVIFKNHIVNGDDKKNWDVLLNRFVKGRMRTTFMKIGDKFKAGGIGYQIKDITPKYKEVINKRLGTKEKIDISELILIQFKKIKGKIQKEEIILKTGEKSTKTGKIVVFAYLAGRTMKDAQKITALSDEEFNLTIKDLNGKIISNETYILLGIRGLRAVIIKNKINNKKHSITPLTRADQRRFKVINNASQQIKAHELEKQKEQLRRSLLDR
ncbi:MAG: Amuc_1099 family pilus-like system protein [Verrucomicrobiota bacterium]|nr:Amuc_1099 family pilus-like system protein [Verrucomicrobiota bacterium]